MSSETSEVKALLFDVFGTVVDWRTSLISDFVTWGGQRGIEADWTKLIDAWKGAYFPAMEEVRKNPALGFKTLDELNRDALDKLTNRFGIRGLTEADRVYLTTGWHRLLPWDDSVPGLARMKTKFTIGPLSNGNFALLSNMAKFAGLPWDIVLSAELFNHYKPDPEAYLGAAKLLGLAPHEVMMVAAHNFDLAAARKLGMKTAFVARPTENGPNQSSDLKAEQEWDIVADDFGQLASRLGC